jgi:hypothetical protein
MKNCRTMKLWLTFVVWFSFPGELAFSRDLFHLREKMLSKISENIQEPKMLEINDLVLKFTSGDEKDAIFAVDELIKLKEYGVVAVGLEYPLYSLRAMIATKLQGVNEPVVNQALLFSLKRENAQPGMGGLEMIIIINECMSAYVNSLKINLKIEKDVNVKDKESLEAFIVLVEGSIQK